MLDTSTKVATTEDTTEDLVREYVVLRGEIQAAEEAHKEAMAKLRESLDNLAAQLLDRCNEQSADSIKTAAGTVSRRVWSRYWTSDWESMYAFIREHDMFSLLEQRIHNANMKRFLEDNPDLMPMGLQADSKYVVQVRRPTKK